MTKGIYVHIPFCASKCNYCDFNSYVANADVRTDYIDALCREIQNKGGFDEKVDTIYFGGGTPTILKPEQLVRVLSMLRSSFCLDENCEITTECNPATMEYDGFRVLRDAGFNRISIGMQSADSGQLKILGRIHSFDDCRVCVDAARRAGFENLSVDIMFGLPNQDVESLERTLQSAAQLSPDHISCYSLKIEEGTPFAKMHLNVADDDESSEMYNRCVEVLQKNGYLRYEISNFAKVGFESRHNCKYWKCEDFIGFGAGAYSCADGVRFSNVRNVGEYIERLGCGKSPIEDTIQLSQMDQMSEFVYLGLRMEDGISEDEFKESFKTKIDEVFGEQIEKNIKRGTIKRDGGRLKIPAEYMYVSNAIMVDFV